MSVTLESHQVKKALHALVDLAIDNKTCQLVIDVNARNSEQIKLHAQTGSRFKFVAEIHRTIDIKSKTAQAELWDFGLEFVALIAEADKSQ